MNHQPYIVNLTQHVVTEDQRQAGIQEPNPEAKEEIKWLLTFNDMPQRHVIEDRAARLAEIVDELGYEGAMIGGAPFLMGPLERAMESTGLKAFYAFTKRVTKEEVGEDGSVRKTAIFVHEGLIPAF